MTEQTPAGGSEHLERLLGATIAQRVREHRLLRDMTITQLAVNVGLSKGMLSKIEHGQTSPSLATLASLAVALEIPVTALFRGLEEEHDAVYVPAGQGIDIEHHGDETPMGHNSQMLGTMRGSKGLLEPILVTATKATEVFPLYQHPGVELLHMLEGVMEYGVGTARYKLNPGDSLQFEGEVPHGPTSMPQIPIRFLSIKAYQTGG